MARLAFVTAVSALMVRSSANAQARRPRRSAPVTVVVEVLERDRTPVIPCGTIGPQPRAVVARVIAVEDGRLDRDRVRLRWPICEFTLIEPGDRFRIRLRRWLDVPADADVEYLVRQAVRMP